MEVNKGNRKHKAAGASQLLRCLALIEDYRDFFGNLVVRVSEIRMCWYELQFTYS